MATTNLLYDIGEALYGTRWQTDLANFLSVSDRTMRRWAADPNSVPAGVWPQLLLALEVHQKTVAKLANRLQLIIANEKQG